MDEVTRFEAWLEGQTDRRDDVGHVARAWHNRNVRWAEQPHKRALQRAMIEFMELDVEERRRPSVASGPNP